MNRKTKTTLKRLFFRGHKALARLGVHVLPVHYYSCVPDVNELERTRAIWAKRSEMPGVEADPGEQLRVLREVALPFQAEFAGNAIYLDATARGFGPGYGYIEAQALHAVVRHFKPGQIIEVGSGVSTRCMQAAAERNADQGRPAQITCIEPYPSAALRALPGVRLIPEKVQETSLSPFLALGENDLLFIDSTHTVKPAGDVNFLFLEVIPRLRPGVIIHIHDIYFPYDHQRDLLATFLFHMENVLLRALLTHSRRLEILFSLSHLHHDCKNELREVFPEYRPQPDRDGLFDPLAPDAQAVGSHFPSSIYLRVRGEP